MEKFKSLSLFKLFFFGYYLPLMAITLIPSILFVFNNPFSILLVMTIPFLLVIFGLPMTAYFPFNDVWDLYVGFAVSLALFLLGYKFRKKTEGKVMVVLGLWGWTLASGLGMGMHG